MLNRIVYCAYKYLKPFNYRKTNDSFKIELFVILLTTPFTRAGYDRRSIFKQSLTVLNSEISFNKAEEPSMSNYLPIARGRIIGFIAFPRVLVLCEKQSASSRIWTRVAVSISYDDNHYTTWASELFVIGMLKTIRLCASKCSLTCHFLSASLSIFLSSGLFVWLIPLSILRMVRSIFQAVYSAALGFNKLPH